MTLHRHAWVWVGSPLPDIPIPSVVAIVPDNGSTDGGTHVVIEVDDSTYATSAAIDGVNLTSFAIDDGTHVSGDTVADAAGAYDVTVASGGGASAPLVAGYTYVIPVPVITSMNFDQGDPIGGESVVISGTGFTGATVVTNVVSFVVYSSIQINAVTAATAAGATTIEVTTPGGTSNAWPFEFWDPSVLNPNWFGDKTLADGTTPGYTVAANGSWLARSHTTTAASRDRTAASAPTDGGGYPVFHRTNSERLDGTVAGMSIVNAWGTGDMTVLVVLNVASIEVEGTHGGGDDASNGAVIGNGDGYGALLLGGAGADEAIFHYHSGGNRSAALTLFATTGRTVLAAKKVDTSPGSADMRITQDGITWYTGDTGVGALTGGSSGQMIWGYTGYLPYFYDGSIKACVLDDTAWSDADVVKFYKWAAARHP